MARKSKEYTMAIKIAGEIEKSFYESTKLSKKELASIAKSATAASKAAQYSFQKDLKNAEPAFRNLEKVASASFKAIETASAVAGAAVTATLAASIKVGADFEEQMSSVQAISMASAEDIELLKEKAKELGKETKFSASEVGKGFEYMAMAGWKTQDMLSGIDGVLSLAAASGEDLGNVSDIVTDAMTAFGLGADQVTRFADVLAVASSNSNTNVAMMGQTFQYVAPVAGALGYTVEDTAVAIGLMANSGIKAEKSGTALRSMFSRLAKPTKEVQKAMDELNLSLTDDKGEMKSFMEIQEDLRKGFQGMTKDHKAEVAAQLAGQEAMSGMLAIANASEEDFNKLRDAINNSSGAAEKMADIRLDNLVGDTTIFKSSMEGLGIQIFEQLDEPLRKAVQEATTLTGKISKSFPTVIRETKEFAKAFLDFSKPFLAVGGWLLKHPNVIVGTIAGIGTAITTYKVVTGISSLASALGALGPAGLTIMGLGAVAGVITAISGAVKKSAAEAKKDNLAKHFGNITLSIEDLQKAASTIIKSKNLEKLQTAMKAFDNLEGIGEGLQSSLEEIQKMNWKISVGMELDDEEKEAYQQEIGNYIDQTQDFVSQKRYALTLAVGVLTDGDLEGSNIITQMGAFYRGKQKELQDVGKQLNETITDAFQDGLLDIDEVKEITELQEKMAKIQSAIAESNFSANLDLLSMKYGSGVMDAESFRNLQAETQEQVAAATADYDEAYTMSVANQKIMLDEGGITQEEYDDNVNILRKSYLDRTSALQAEALDFQVGTILQQYADADTVAQQALAELMGSGDWSSSPAQAYENLIHSKIGAGAIDKHSRRAMDELYGELQPLQEQLENMAQQYTEMGEDIPQDIQTALEQASKLQIYAGKGDQNDLYHYFADQVANNEEYQKVLEAAKKSGFELPENIASAMAENQKVIDEQVTSSYYQTKDALQNTYGKGYHVTVPVTTSPAGKGEVPEHYAKGGIVTNPCLTWFAEDSPEAAIPLDGSTNAIRLWEETGKLLGMPGLTGGEEPLTAGIQMASETITGGETKIVYQPQNHFEFKGNQPAIEELENAMETDREKFARMMDDYMKENRRVSY